MGERGPVPDPNAKRRNIDGQFTIVEWSELVDGEDVPPMPAGAWGEAACRLWDDLWRGPLRKELLPQHREALHLLIMIVERLHDPEISATAFKDYLDRFMKFSKMFGLDPSAVRGLRISVEPAKRASKPDGSGEAEDEVAKKRAEMQKRMGKAAGDD